jgi:hypothetical protein
MTGAQRAVKAKGYSSFALVLTTEALADRA